MRFKDLVAQYRWLDVCGFLLMYYPEQKKSLDGYREVYKVLEGMESTASDMRICIEHFIDTDGTELEDVSGRNGKHNKDLEEWSEWGASAEFGEKEISWGLDFTEWNEWLGMEIDTQALEYYNGPAILALCLYEMTFYGYDPKSIRVVKDEVDGRVEDYNAHKEFAIDL